MATFADIATRVVQNTGRDDKQTQIEDRVKDSMKEIQRLHNLYFMEEIATRALVVDRQDYDVPADFKDVNTFWAKDTAGEFIKPPLLQFTFEEAREKYSKDDGGTPEAFTIYRAALFVWPPKPKSASETLHLEYYKFLPDISGGSSNELTINWADLVESWATWQFYAKLPNANDEADFWQKLAQLKFQELVKFSNAKKLKNKIGMRISDSPRLVPKNRLGRPFGGR